MQIRSPVFVPGCFLEKAKNLNVCKIKEFITEIVRILKT